MFPHALLATATLLAVLVSGEGGLEQAMVRRQQPNATSIWPYGPFSTRGRDIVNTRGEAMTFAGVSWPLSGNMLPPGGNKPKLTLSTTGETMIPEGLEYASADSILAQVASVGFNFVRMPYAVQMIDEIYARNGTDVPLERALVTSLGPANGTRILDAVLANNPIWTRSTPRLKIWTDIARLAARRNILIHPDARVGKAGPCCSHTDGNAWFQDMNLPVSNWTRALSYVANWARNHTNVVSMSIISSPRESYLRPELEYNWKTFVGNMTLGASAIHTANPDILITWTGLQFGEDLSALTAGKNLLTAPCYRCRAIRDALRRPPEVFSLPSSPFSNKVVYELNLRSDSENLDTGSCRIIETELYRNGFNALGIPRPAGCNVTADCTAASSLTPVILSEFGHAQDESLATDILQNCIRDFTTRNNVSWATWSLAGKWRGRPGEDTTGLLNASWSGWRYSEGVEKWWKPWVADMRVLRPS